MGMVMITCPTTGRAIPTGIEADQHSFRNLPDSLSQTKCPHCGLKHVWWTREAWLAADNYVPPTAVVRQRKKTRKIGR
jgi:hypothetical protein